jgi:SAM-dependent methyltransferase
MAQYLECTFCRGRGVYNNSPEIAEVPVCVKAFAGEKFWMWRCSNCNSLHARDMVDLPKYYALYPFKDHKLDYHTRVAYQNRIKMLLSHGVSKDMSVLDYGCGAGIFLEFLSRAGFRSLSGYDAFIPKYSEPSILDKKYDVVTSYDVIEHLDDPRSYLSALLKPLKKGGLLVIGTPNADYISLKAEPYFQVELSQPYHRHIFSEKALRSLCAEFGLEPVFVYRRFYFDSLYPAVNTRFMWEYVNQNGGFLDVCVKPLKISQILKSPKLFFYAFFGYFLPEHANILLTFRYTGDSVSAT